MSQWDELADSRVFRSSFPDVEATGFRTGAWQHGVPTADEELKPYHRSLLHALVSAAKVDATTGITLVTDDEEVEEHRSYREIYHAARGAAAALAALGLRAGDRALIVLPTSFDFAIAFFGVQMLGAIPVPTYPPAGLRVATGIDRISHIAAHSRARFCITNQLIRSVLGELALRMPLLERILPIEELKAPAEPRVRLRASGDSHAFIQYTSGSTDKPKGVLLAHRNLVANIHAIGQALRITRRDTTVSWLPLYHDMGLIGTFLFSIYWRIPLVLMSPTTFLMRPVRWLQAIQRHRGTLSPAPNFAYALCVRRVKADERRDLDLSSWRLAMNGAEPVNYRTLTAFQRAYEPHGFRAESMLPVYGLAECSLAATFPELGSRPRCDVLDRAELANGHARVGAGKAAMEVVSVGRPVPGHEVAVIDENGVALPEREVGHVLVRGPSLMLGYFENPEATDAVIRDGWLWTGDLGYFSGGELYVTGRVKDLIILRGRNHYAEDLERAAEQVEGARPGGVMAFGVYDEEKAVELVVLLAETRLERKEEQTDLSRRIAEAVAESCDVRLDEVVLTRPGTLPKTSSGKKQRSRGRELYLAGALNAPRNGKLDLAKVYVRSRAGYLIAGARRLIGSRRRAPD